MATNVKGLNNFLRKIHMLQGGFENATYRIVGELADKGDSFLNGRYTAINYDISNNEIPIVSNEIVNNNKSKVIAQGRQVAYIEFGTGNIGSNTVSYDLIRTKNQIGIKPYNSGPHVKENVPILENINFNGRNEYKRVTGWYKPDYALSDNERMRYERWIAGLQASITNPSRLYHAKKKAWRYTHGTEGIMAGQQIFSTAIHLKNIAPDVVKKIIKEELQ